MDFGLSFLPDVNDKKCPAPDYFKNAITLSKFADTVGFKTIKMTEHYFQDYGGYCPSPLIFLASIASITKKIRLMTGCILPAFHHPIQIAAETALLDAISQGRLDVGFARAYLPYEFSALGVDINTSRDRYEKTIETVKKLWTEKNVSAKTDFFTFSDVNSLPIPTQKPHPPIWGAAVNSRQTFAWLGEKSCGLLVTPPITMIEDLVEKLEIYRESFIPDETIQKPTVAISLPLLIRNNQKEAEEEGDVYLSEYIRVWAKAADSWNTLSSTNYPGYTGLSYALRQNTPKKMRDTMQAMIGTPDFIAEKIQTLSRLTRVDQILWQIDFGGKPLKSAMNTLNLFVSNVLPLINKESSYEKAHF